MRRLFWTLYIFDRNMSLLLDRPSKLHDRDIDTAYPEVSTNPQVRPWDEAFIMFIRLAKLQGHLYNELYSLVASEQSSAERAERADKILATLQRWKSDLDSVFNAL